MKNLRLMDTEDVVLALIGPVVAVGETNEDADRLANLKEMAELVDRLLYSISQAAMSANNHQHSMKAIGKYAQEFLESVRNA